MSSPSANRPTAVVNDGLRRSSDIRLCGRVAHVWSGGGEDAQQSMCSFFAEVVLVIVSYWLLGPEFRGLDNSRERKRR